MHLEEEISGKTIIDVKVLSPTIWLRVKGGGWVEISAEGDCCSEAFIDAVFLSGNPTLTGKVEEITFAAQPTSQEVDELSFVKLAAERGYVAFLHRNSSNGYYGNYLNVNSRGEPPVEAEDGKNWFRKIFPVD